jgi:hypothetical protein
MTIRQTASLLTIILLTTSGSLWAQAEEESGQASADPAVEQAEPMPQQQNTLPEVSEEQIQAFVQAYVSLSEVREEYSTRVQEAENQEEARQLQQEANNAMTTAIEDAGLTVEEYQQVALAINANAEIRERVTEMLSEQGAL